MQEINFYKNNRIRRVRFYVILYTLFLSFLFLFAPSIHTKVLNLGEYFFADEAAGLSYYTLRSDPEVPSCNLDLDIESEIQLHKNIINFYQSSQLNQLHEELSDVPLDQGTFQHALEELQIDCQKKHDEYQTKITKLTPQLKFFRSTEKIFYEIFQLQSQFYFLFTSVIVLIICLIGIIVFIPVIGFQHLKLLPWHLTGVLFIVLGSWPWLEMVNFDRFQKANVYLQRLNPFPFENQQVASSDLLLDSQSVDHLDSQINAAKPTSAVQKKQETQPLSTEKEPILNEPNEKNIRAEISEVLNHWLDAWRSRNVKKYLTFYSAEFKPTGATGYQEWVNDRKLKLQKNTEISVSIKKIQITHHNNKATVRFVQNYRSRQHADITRKTMVLQKELGEWKIISERATP